MVWENLNESAMPLLEGILMMNDFTLLVSRSERLTYAREHLNEMFGKNIRRISVQSILHIIRMNRKNWLLSIIPQEQQVTRKE